MSMRAILAVFVVLFSGGTMAAADDFVVVDQAALNKLVAPGAKLEKVASGMKFIEGPVWFESDGGYLVFSDIPNNRLHRWSAAGGLSVFRQPSNNSNGNTRDREGRLVSCEHGSRQVTRTEADGTVTVLARDYQGKRLNSPNDVVAKSDGTIWFTDPPYGLRDQKVGKELDKQYVFRLDPSGALTAVASDFVRPNGLCFSPDEKKLYIADSAGPWDGQATAWVRVFDVAADNTLSGGQQFCKIDKGVPDGMRVDEQGNLWCTAGDGVRIYSPSGAHVGTILCPETPANCAFGGSDGRTLFMTSNTSLYTIPTLTRDAAAVRRAGAR
jgi:gluconolactonase